MSQLDMRLFEQSVVALTPIQPNAKSQICRAFAGLLALSAVILSGCSTNNTNSSRFFGKNPNDYANVGSVRQPLGGTYGDIDIPQNVSRVVYYRTGALPNVNPLAANNTASNATNSQGGITYYDAATVYLNDDYHASLVPGSYSDVCVAPGPASLGTRMVDVRGRVKDGFDTVTPVDLKGGQTTYVRVLNDGTSAKLETVSQSLALQELPGTRLQRHTISRVSNAIACNGGPATQSNFDLRADALFAFGRSDLASMTRAGRQSLNELIQKIRDKYVTVRQITLVGHTDPFGSAAANQQLSLARANTVRDYLLNNGLQGVSINTEGLGASQLVKTDCGTTATAEAISCNQPNRRVSVEVLGAGR